MSEGSAVPLFVILYFHQRFIHLRLPVYRILLVWAQYLLITTIKFKAKENFHVPTMFLFHILQNFQ